MKRNCNLELRLLPRQFSDPWNIINPNMEEASDESLQDEQKQQQLTIFYNGTVCVSEVTELQARAIILLARENDEKLNKNRSAAAGFEPITPSIHSPSPSPSSAHQMRKSLQMFLQKRKHRVQATSPYNY